MNRRKKQDPQVAVDAWNAKYPVGTEVEFQSYKPDGPVDRYKTSTEAEVLSGHTAVVWLTGKSGCVCLDHCKAVAVPQAQGVAHA